MEIIADIADMQSRGLAARAAGRKIAFVPTMGYLHEGHLSLLRAGRERSDLLVLSIFVNPAQFGPHEDLDRYPRDFERDEALARQAGVDLVFYPAADSIYPPGYATYVDVAGGLSDSLEGASRPGHFRGVATVVAKLFNIVQPHTALFGRKDFQQLAVIRRMTVDLDLPIEIVGLPIVREADGLAMSSRNVYLSTPERQQALALVAGLQAANHAYCAGEREARRLIDLARAEFAPQPDLTIDYLKICATDGLAEVDTLEGEAVMLVAARVGRTRLIDNHVLGEKLSL